MLLYTPLSSRWTWWRLPVLALGLAIATAPIGGRAQGAVRQGQPQALDVVPVRDNIHLIAGAGGNILMQVGPAGVILVDSGSQDRAGDVLAAVRRLTPLPVRYIINTSAALDHVGGNADLARAGLSILPGAVAAGAGISDDLITNGGGASVLAHENVLTQLSVRDTSVRSAFWPTKTFAFGSYSMYLNGEGIQVLHQPAATTDGDVIVFFRRGDVIATGDIVDMTRFPEIDTARGGSIQGELDALNRLMQLSILNLPLMWEADRTLLVPGHGRVFDKMDLLEYRDAVTIVRDRIADLIAQGRSLDEVMKADPTMGFRRRYGSESGSWTTERFVEAVFHDLTAASAARRAD